jgi:hypothetical protein
MIQALFRTTGGTVHGLERDDFWGYGIVSADQLVRVLPTTFPDENPMLFDGTDRVPLVSEVLTSEATASPTPTATTDPPTTAAPQDDETDDTSAPIGLIAGIAGGIALALILTVVLIGRRRPDATTDTDQRGAHDA